MSHLRRFCGPLTVMSLLVPIVALVAAPVAAQDDDDRTRPLTVFVFSNVMTNADRDTGPDEDWQVRVSVRPLGQCRPTRGDIGGDIPWLDVRSEAGALLSLEECVFSISATVRDASRTRDCVYRGQLAWGPNPREVDFVDDRLLTISRPDDETRISIRREPNGPCGAPTRTHFFISPDDIVEDLPDASADEDLLALARRAAALTEFRIRVEADPSSDRPASPGCDGVTTFTVRGDGQRVATVLHNVVSAGSCPLRATVVDAPAPFEAPEGSSVTFDGGNPNILVNLSRLVRLRPARIAIIQDVDGSNNRGAVTYSINRSCGNVSVTSPATGAVSELYEGRFAVHAPHSPAFGAGSIFAVGASGATSTSLVGCSARVTISGVPAGCSVAGGNTRRLTWSAADPFEHFDFEFVIRCGEAATATTPSTLAPPSRPTTTTQPPAEEAQPMAEDAQPLAEEAQPLEEDPPAGSSGDATDAIGPPLDSPTG